MPARLESSLAGGRGDQTDAGSTLLGVCVPEMHAWLDTNCGADGWRWAPAGLRGLLNEAIPAEGTSSKRLRLDHDGGRYVMADNERGEFGRLEPPGAVIPPARIGRRNRLAQRAEILGRS